MEKPVLSGTVDLPLNSYDFDSISLLDTRGSSNIDLYNNSLDILSLKFVGSNYNIPIGNYFYLFSPASATTNSIIRIQVLGINVFRRLGTCALVLGSFVVKPRKNTETSLTPSLTSRKILYLTIIPVSIPM